MKRYNVYRNDKLVGQDYQREDGTWMHKWVDFRLGGFERGSWRGRCEFEDNKNIRYKEVLDE